MRMRARVDANQGAIVKALRQAGCSVESLASLGQGVPDLLVGWRGRNLLFEVKDGSKPPSARKLTDEEQEWHQLWRGQVVVVNDVHEALGHVGVGASPQPSIQRSDGGCTRETCREIVQGSIAAQLRTIAPALRAEVVGAALVAVGFTE